MGLLNYLHNGSNNRKGLPRDHNSHFCPAENTFYGLPDTSWFYDISAMGNLVRQFNRDHLYFLFKAPSEDAQENCFTNDIFIQQSLQAIHPC